MKLGTKLLLAPLLTGVIALSGGAVNAVLSARAASATASAFDADMQALRTIDQVKEQMGLLHASVYRSLALMASLDEAAVTTFRKDLKQQVEAMVRVAGSLSAPAGEAGPMQPQITQASQALAAYGMQADNAVDMASVDPNTGVAAMQNADASFKQASVAMAAIVTSMDAAAKPAAAASPAAAAVAAPAPAPAVKARKLSYKEKREFEELPARIATLEAEQKTLSAQLASSELYTGPADQAAALQARFAQIDDELLAALERWELLGGA